MTMKTVVRQLKQRFLPGVPVRRSIVTGPMRGIALRLNLHHQSQLWFGLAELSWPPG